MAVRTGAGTGVIVSLVVFVLTTVFLLVLTIVFYAGKTEALEQQNAISADLAKFVKPQQRGTDEYRSIETDAVANGQSVTEHLKRQVEDMLRYVNGDPNVDVEQLKAGFERLGVEDGGVVRHTLEEMSRSLRNRQAEIDGLNQRYEAAEAELAEKEAQIATLKQNHQDQLDLIRRDIDAYGSAGDEMRQQLRETIIEMNRASDRLEAQYADRLVDLQDELDDSNRDLVLLRSRVGEYQKLLDNLRPKSQDPSLLVDGMIIDVDAATDQVFIDRGKRDRVVLGMTFEVYDDASSIRVDERTGLLPRGKASLQVVKVGEATSTCKLTRKTRGRPVVRNNVIANAIYDPDYKFKFLVHGMFDVDGDGRPSEQEADYLRSLVVKWGGAVVEGDELPGDLDFLVLGEMPPQPPILKPNSTPQQTKIWAEQRAARQLYEDLFRNASEAQIPVINANRFFVLLGHTER